MRIKRFKSIAWDVLRSPKTVAFLKLGAAAIAVIHAVDELMNSPAVGKRQIGFHVNDEEE
jgi:hypothetical protein